MSVEDERIEKMKQRLFSNSGKELPEMPRSRLQKHQVLVKEGWEDDGADEALSTRPQNIGTIGASKPDAMSGISNGVMHGSLSSAGPVSAGSMTGINAPAAPRVSAGMSGMDVRGSRREQGDPKDRGPLFKKILGLSIILFLLATAFAAYVYYSGSNLVSNNSIDIQLVGPVTSPAGDVLSLEVDITNRNAADLELADLVVTYPEGTRNADDKVTAMPLERIPVGTVPKGRTVRQNIKAVLFGEENAKKTIKMSLEYRLGGSSNIFVKDKDFPIFIGSSPITVNVDSDKEVIPEQEHQFKISIKSNSASVIKGLVFKVEYPFGFDFISALPTATGDNQTWVLGDIQPGEERQITITGRILGGQDQERVFKFYTGTEDPNDKTSIGTIFVSNSESIVLKKPFLSSDLALDGKTTSTYIAEAGNVVNGEITWQNNLNVSLNDVVIEAKLTGDMLDRSKVRGDQGFYRSADNTIVWDKTTLPALKELKAGNIGRIRFTFAALPPNTQNNSTFRKPSIGIDLSVRAKRFDEDNVPQEIASNVTRTVKVTSDIVATTKLVRSIGPYENTGPMPTQPEATTTYTVLVSLKNSYNSLKDVVYTATLPQYVTWIGQAYPTNSAVSYSPDKRQLTWQVGDMQPGVGYSASAKEFAFQVGFFPSLGQRGSTPEIITGQSVFGKDNFTGEIINAVPSNLDIKTESEPTFKYGDDKVGGAN